ncbi:phage tail protein, partial [Enterobacter hormaechei]
TANTTKASDGTLKAASPVARIVKSKDESQRSDVAEEGYNWCGCGTANAEAEGIKISRLDVGVYVLIGSAGLASEGWQLLPPMDPGGMGELGVVEAEQTESGGLTIRLFKRKYMLSDDGEIVKTKGAPMDVPANSWIDVRLDMPEDSIWKTRASEASLELTEQPEDIQP